MVRQFACLGIIIGWCAAVAPQAAQLGAPGASAAQWLVKAETWLGGHDQLRRVSALEIGRGQEETIRILLPDKYQLETMAPFGKMTITFDGATIWTRSDVPTLNTAAADVAPDVLRKRGLGRLAEMTLTYLARPPAALPVTARLTEGQCGMVDGICVAFEAGTSSPMFLVLARDDGRPLALVRMASPLPDQAPTQEYVSEFADYRTVSGLKFPFKIATRRRELSTGKVEALTTWTYRSYVVNPSLRPADFVKRPEGRR